ncbi:MAG: hypothetical protein HY671_02805 [Chloroflexi bacterium]|nr:hypothetical protein [Chloroflexota bacterium]
MALKKRVEVLFDPGQYAKLEKVARNAGESVGSLVRKAVEREYLRPTDDERRQAVRELLQMRLPIGDWEDVEADLLKLKGLAL